MSPSNRREFLKLAAATAVAANSPLTWASSTPTPARAWATSQDRRLQEIKLPPWRKAATGGTPGIQIDAGVRFQEILGFGAAFTDASCYLLSTLESEKRKALLSDLIGPDGLRLSVGG